MKKIFKEFKEIIDEYGIATVGIAMIIFVGYATSYFTICGLWWCFISLIGGRYTWDIPSVTWGVALICAWILKIKTKREIEKEQEVISNGRYN